MGDGERGLRGTLAVAERATARGALRKFDGDDFPEVQASSSPRRVGSAIVSSGAAG